MERYQHFFTRLTADSRKRRHDKNSRKKPVGVLTLFRQRYKLSDGVVQRWLFEFYGEPDYRTLTRKRAAALQLPGLVQLLRAQLSASSSDLMQREEVYGFTTLAVPVVTATECWVDFRTLVWAKARWQPSRDVSVVTGPVRHRYSTVAMGPVFAFGAFHIYPREWLDVEIGNSDVLAQILSALRGTRLASWNKALRNPQVRRPGVFRPKNDKTKEEHVLDIMNPDPRAFDIRADHLLQDYADHVKVKGDSFKVELLEKYFEVLAILPGLTLDAFLQAVDRTRRTYGRRFADVRNTMAKAKRKPENNAGFGWTKEQQKEWLLVYYNYYADYQLRSAEEKTRIGAPYLLDEFLVKFGRSGDPPTDLLAPPESQQSGGLQEATEAEVSPVVHAPPTPPADTPPVAVVSPAPVAEAAPAAPPAQLQPPSQTPQPTLPESPPTVREASVAPVAIPESPAQVATSPQPVQPVAGAAAASEPEPEADPAVLLGAPVVYRSARTSHTGRIVGVRANSRYVHVRKADGTLFPDVALSAVTVTGPATAIPADTVAERQVVVLQPSEYRALQDILTQPPPAQVPQNSRLSGLQLSPMGPEGEYVPHISIYNGDPLPYVDYYMTDVSGDIEFATGGSRRETIVGDYFFDVPDAGTRLAVTVRVADADDIAGSSVGSG